MQKYAQAPEGRQTEPPCFQSPTCSFLPPLRGSAFFFSVFPGLTPRAILYRRSAALCFEKLSWTRMILNSKSQIRNSKFRFGYT